MTNEHSNEQSKVKGVTVEVNSRPVALTEKKMMGAEIKATAIAQGVQIQLDFVLQLERPNGEFDTIGDADELNIRKGLSFTAIAPDDNS
jgi:Multiubiquitin